MANSDNVVRAGLTPKYKDIENLLDIINYNFKPVSVISPPPGEKIFTYNTPVSEFNISRIVLEKSQDISLQTNDSLIMSIILDGIVNVSYKNSNGPDEMIFQKGDSFIIPAAINHITLSASEQSLLFIVNISS
jgi:mannose-6-phosphate isomerase